jgi:hypothetical protein
MLQSQMKTMIIIFLDIMIIIHFELSPQGHTVNQAYYVEILKGLCEAVHRRRPELWPSDQILCHDNAAVHDALSEKQFLAQKSITELEHPSCSPDYDPNDFCFQKLSLP